MNPPRHIAIIPDGNRRWAKQHGLSAREGHRKGVTQFREISQAVLDEGIPYFTFWAASEDNLTKRSRLEVKFLLSLLRAELERELASDKFEENKVRVRIIGRYRELI